MRLGRQELKKTLDNLTKIAYDITLSVLASLILSKVVTITQSNSRSDLHFHICISVSQMVTNIGIVVFAEYCSPLTFERHQLASKGSRREVDGKLCIAAPARIWYVCRYV